MNHGGMAHMSGHLFMSTLRPISPGEQKKADAIIVAAAKTAMEPYQDYRKALADGYRSSCPTSRRPSTTSPGMSLRAKH
jgi:hypothetical protein